jgi:ABC-type nitrate/sulfonate/bicarbonate transport system permease component
LQVADTIIDHPDEFLSAAGQTALLAFTGALIGTLAGITAALTARSSAFVRGATELTAVTMRVLPIAALVPIAVAVFGYGALGALVVSAAVAAAPTYILVLGGLHAASERVLPPMASLGASRFAMTRFVYVPAAVPRAASALRIVAPATVVTTMLAEYLMAGGGLGDLFAAAQVSFSPELAWGAAVVSTAVAVVFGMVARVLERLANATFV